MSITVLYAQHLTEEKLQRNTIKSYVSDARQFIAWKEMFSPRSNIELSLLEQYIKTASFAHSPHTIRRKQLSLVKFVMWVNKPATSNKVIKNVKAKLIPAVGVIILLLIFIASTPSNIAEDYQHSDFPLNNHFPSKVDANVPDTIGEVASVDIAVSGYDITTPLQDTSAEVLLALEGQYDETNNNSIDTLSPKGGTEQIEKGDNYTVIIDESINSDTIITVSPTSPTSGNNLFIKSQGKGFAVVAIESITEHAIPFNWIAL